MTSPFRCSDGEPLDHKYNQLIGDQDYILYNITRKAQQEDGTARVSTSCEAYIRAGPRAVAHFDPPKVNAAIVSCGGLCPGLNNVIRELVHTLHYQYAVNKVVGIRGGFHGFHEHSHNHPKDCHTPDCTSSSTGHERFGGSFQDNTTGAVVLTPATVHDIHHQGGTVLSSSRGGFDADVILNYLIKYNITQLYIIGGDGTHRAANALCQECLIRGLNIAIAGIPKTIDNDVDLIDRSFGFQTSVEEALVAIKAAKVEAQCNYPNGVGIIQLMGRSSGLIAAHATLSSGDVDLCLVPEVKTPFEGEKNALAFLKRRVEANGHAVIVVAEGFGEVIFGQNTETDAGGNRKLPPVGPYMKSLVEDYFKSQGSVASVKFIDPSYMIRSVPANSSDSIYCMMLAQNAVHGAMAGYTNFSTGLINNRVCYIPIPRIVATSPRGVDPRGRTWERVLSLTRQPQCSCE